MRVVTQDRSWRRQEVKDIAIEFVKWLDANKDVDKTYDELFYIYNKERNLNI